MTIIRLAAMQIGLASRHRHQVLFAIKAVLALITIVALAINIVGLEFVITGGQMSAIELADP
jgi:hypothetical protein